MLEDFRQGRLSAEDITAKLSVLPYQDIGFAKVDHHRELRLGFPEVVFGQGKSPEQIAAIAGTLLETSDRLLVTKASPDAFAAVRDRAPGAVYDEMANVIMVDRRESRERVPGVVVASGGTSDMPVACEAAVTAELMDCEVERVFDVGVAGIHRLFDNLPMLREARVVVVVAGMEGALPSVIGGLVSAPIVAVPTSIGYGASFEGVAPLLAMLNSCAPGVAVVNIDNGFGAGFYAALIARSAAGAQ
jgi:NCAIR mutase (PurE)-related protein